MGSVTQRLKERIAVANRVRDLQLYDALDMLGHTEDELAQAQARIAELEAQQPKPKPKSKSPKPT